MKLDPEDLEAMRSLSKQRLPIQSKHVEALIDMIESIDREAYNRGLEDAAQAVATRYTGCFDAAKAIRALKGA